MSKYPIFRHYLEDEDDKPYYTMNSLSFYYEDMERKQKLIESLAKSIAGYDIRLTENLEVIEKEVDRRLADWDKQLETFPDSVEGLLTKWSTDGTIDTVIQTALIDEKIEPLTVKLAEKAEKEELEVVNQRVNTFIELPEGATTNDARLEDIKVADDGTVYDSPGEAVRAIGSARRFTDVLLKKLYEDNYGLVHSFDGSLYRNPVMDEVWEYNENPVQLVRASTSFNANGNEIASNVPVYEDFKLRGEGALRVAPNTLNRFSATNSIEFLNPETVQLTAGTYTVSINKGEGKLVMSGGVTGEISVGQSYKFTLASDASVTFTPNSGTPKLSQLERWGYKTPWQKGGVDRVGDSPRLILDTTPIGEFGIGSLIRFHLDSNVSYENNEYWLIHGHFDDSVNYFRVVYRTALQQFYVQYNANGVGKSFSTENISFNKNDLIGLYLHVVPNEGLYLYIWKNGVITVNHLLEDDTPVLSTGLKQIAIGHRLRALTQRSFFTNALYSNFTFDQVKPDPQKYFKEVL